MRRLLFACFMLSWARIGARSAWTTAKDESDCAASGNCVLFCCPPGLYKHGSRCMEEPENPAPYLELPPVFGPDLKPLENASGVEFSVMYKMPCSSTGSYALSPEEEALDEFYLMANGSVSRPRYPEGLKVLNFGQFCFASLLQGNQSRTVVAACFETTQEKRNVPAMFAIAMLLSTPFLIATFFVYTVLPEFDNIHGLTLRAYIAALFLAYLGLVVVQLGDQTVVKITVLCTTLAFVIHFSFLASFFWLNVMCVDIWWTFAGYRSIQGSVRQRERKKFILYSIYAWGCACLLTGICIIMEYAPGIPSNVVRPEFGVEKCWFKTEMAKAYYFYIPMGLTVLCNIILFILTAAKIIQHKKNTAHQLKGTESRRHDDNKQWFNLYLKLFIVMGINWSMEIISWAYKSPEYLWYITDLANTLQGVIIFIIFVWKEKIKRLLIKRFGCKGENFLSRDSTRSAYHSSTSRTCTTSVPLNEKTNSCPEPAAKYKSTNFDDSDGA
ncbi:G-protein coupled receptor Mth2 isoform X4 [Neodiprion lecontei]|uniref:G-protein coupled receptor Mth2 isoform X4 n=1 Tax=Neodiprion lecontei TaxID=441921 RepID=A0A6J0BHN1_NEOLC|nr:G-protein coupled receptor Mth2 isoform X4 [Neodiprion lecontei]